MSIIQIEKAMYMAKAELCAVVMGKRQPESPGGLYSSVGSAAITKVRRGLLWCVQSPRICNILTNP